MPRSRSPPAAADEDDLVRRLVEAGDVDDVIERMELEHYRHLVPIVRRLSAFDRRRPAARRASLVSPPPPDAPDETSSAPLENEHTERPSLRRLRPPSASPKRPSRRGGRSRSGDRHADPLAPQFPVWPLAAEDPPTATTEEAHTPDEEEEEFDGAFHAAPPRIIEREQHRRPRPARTSSSSSGEDAVDAARDLAEAQPPAALKDADADKPKRRSGAADGPKGPGANQTSASATRRRRRRAPPVSARSLGSASSYSYSYSYSSYTAYSSELEVEVSGSRGKNARRAQSVSPKWSPTRSGRGNGGAARQPTRTPQVGRELARGGAESQPPQQQPRQPKQRLRLQQPQQQQQQQQLKQTSPHHTSVLQRSAMRHPLRPAASASGSPTGPQLMEPVGVHYAASCVSLPSRPHSSLHGPLDLHAKQKPYTNGTVSLSRGQQPPQAQQRMRSQSHQPQQHQRGVAESTYSVPHSSAPSRVPYVSYLQRPKPAISPALKSAPKPQLQPQLQPQQLQHPQLLQHTRGNTSRHLGQSDCAVPVVFQRAPAPALLAAPTLTPQQPYAFSQPPYAFSQQPSQATPRGVSIAATAALPVGRVGEGGEVQELIWRSGDSGCVAGIHDRIPRAPSAHLNTPRAAATPRARSNPPPPRAISRRAHSASQMRRTSVGQSIHLPTQRPAVPSQREPSIGTTPRQQSMAAATTFGESPNPTKGPQVFVIELPHNVKRERSAAPAVLHPIANY